MLQKTKPFATLFDPDNQSFLSPGKYAQATARILGQHRTKCRRFTWQHCSFYFGKSILKYRYTAECIENITGRSFDVIHIVGENIQNKLYTILLQMPPKKL